MNTLKFDAIEIHPVKDYGEYAEVVDDDRDADFFGLYGRVDGHRSFYVAIGDFNSRDAAELTRELLDNKKSGLPPKL